MEVNKIKEIVCESGKKLLADGLVSGTWGNLSCRVDDKYMVITPSGIKYEDLIPADMILMRIDDLTYEGDQKPSSEKYIHANIYKARKDINAIVHNHSLYASIISAVSSEVQPYVSDMAMILGPSVKIASHEMSGSKELSEGVLTALEDRYAAIMQNHGAICAGRDMEEAFIACHILEKACQIQVSVEMLGGGEPLKREIAQEYRNKYLNVYQKKITQLIAEREKMDKNIVSTEESKNGNLKKVMGFWDLVLYGLVFMYPLAAFNYLGYEQVASNGHATLVYLGGGLVVFFTSLSYAKWVQTYPNTGSAYFYTCQGVGPRFGFIVGWVMMLDYILTPLFILIMIGEYMHRNFPALPYAIWMLIFAAVIFLINYLGLKLSKIFDIGMFAIILIIAGSVSVLGAVYLQTRGISLWNPAVIYNSETFDFGKVSMAAALVVLSFLGFDAITTLSEESKCTPKKISNAIIVAVIAQALLLGFLAYVGSSIFPDASMIEDPDTVAYELYTAVGGANFNFVMNLLSQFGLLACATCATTGATRLLYAMGRDNVLPRKVFGHLDSKTQVPSYCVIVVMGISVIGALFLDWAVIAEIVSFGALFGFIFVNISCFSYFWIKRKEKMIFRNLLLPFIGLIGVLFVLVNTSTICKTVGLVWLACGIIYLLIKWKTSQDFRDAINRGMDIE